MKENTTVKCDYCGANTPQNKIIRKGYYKFCGYCVEEMGNAKETRWNAKTDLDGVQGTICDDYTGRTVAVAYDHKDAHLLAAAPAMLEVVKWAYKHWGVVPRAIQRKASDIVADLQEAAERNGDTWED